MKKFYSVLALAAAVALSANAAGVKKTDIQQTYEFAGQKIEFKAATKAPGAKAPAASNIEELQGIYTGTCYMPFEGMEGKQTLEYAILPGSDANHIQILGLMPEPVEALVNWKGGVITIPGTLPMQVGQSQATMVHWRWNDNGQGTYECNDEPVQWDILKDGVIAAADSYDILLCQGTEGFYIFGGYAFEMTKTVSDASVEWETVGTASFVDDGYVLPNYGWETTAPTLTCDLQRDKAKPTHLRLNNPYATLNSLVGAELNEADLPGCIELDATNKDCVIVPRTFLGFCSGGPWFGRNMEAGAVEGGDTPEALIEAMGKDALSYIDYDNHLAIIRNCEWSNGSTQNTTWSAFFEQWIPNEPKPSDTFTISLPDNLKEPSSAITEIEADANAPVEYFNLQGIRVANPENGVFVRRQGNTVTKVVK